MTKRSKSSQRWLDRQRRDYFTRQARAEGQVSRAHYKLQELDRRFHLLRGDSRVLELGAAPGGWTNYIEAKLSKGVLIAVDPLAMTAGTRARIIEGYAGEETVDRAIDEAIEEFMGGENLDLVLSDMAPNISGVRAVDQARALDLADTALAACEKWLRRDGSLVMKTFQGEGLDAWLDVARTFFASAKLTKPKASRDESREVFVVARGYAERR